MKRSAKNKQFAIKPGPVQNRMLMVGTPTTGNITFEWHMAYNSMITPCNWQMGLSAPMGHTVADGRNVVVQSFLEQGYKWLFFLDHDVMVPMDVMLKIADFTKNPSTPVMCGLYKAKSNYPEPLLYRGRGNSYFNGWKQGDKVWADGIPMGCTLIHRSLLEVMAESSPKYVVQGGSCHGVRVSKVFETPRIGYIDPEKNVAHIKSGTEDLHWCDRVIKEDFITRAGWKKAAKRQYPFLCDTSINCGHIDHNTHRIY